MTEAIKLDVLDDYYVIDEETGEMIEKRSELTTKELPQIARRLRAIESQITETKLYKDAEIERIKAICDQKIYSIKNQKNFWLKQAQLLMEQAGDKKLHYPGLGRFRWQKGSTVLDSKAYDEATEDEKIKLRSAYEPYFKYKEPQPSITDIRAAMKNGGVDEEDYPVKLSDYFKLITNEDKFIFKGE